MERVRDTFSRDDVSEDVSDEFTPESLLATGTAIAAGMATRICLRTLWRRTLNREPPLSPSQKEVSWADALIWAVSVGAAVGVSQVLAHRGFEAGMNRWR